MKTIFFITAILYFSVAFSQMMPEKFATFYDELGMDNFEEKQVKIDKKIKKSPNEPWYYWMKAEIFQMMGDEAKAIENFEKSIKIDSTFSAGHGSFARFLYGKENPNLKEALTHINKAIQLDDTEKYYLIDRGNIYLLAGEYEKAIEDANTVLKLNEETYIIDAVQLIIETMLAQNRTAELKTYLENFDFTSLGGFMDPNFDEKLGDLYLEFGDKEKACKSYGFAADTYLIVEEPLPAGLDEKIKKCK
ncbi:MAG: tetratricopeptide repeat protein [Flavobacteriia bacterium]